MNVFKDGSKTPKPPDPSDDPDLGLGSSTTQGSAGFDQQHNPDPAQATLKVSQTTTMATTAVSQTSTTATTTVSQDNQATITVSQPSTTATTTVSLLTTATSTESQSVMSHTTVSSPVGDASQSTSSLLTAAGELEAVLDQVSLVNTTTVPQGPVTGDVLATGTPSGPQGSANPAALAAQQLSANVPGGNQFQVAAQVHADDKASQSANSANPVPGLPVVSADDIEGAADSGVAPNPDLGTTLVDIMVGHKLSHLQLSSELGSDSASGTGQFAVGSGPGPGPGTGIVPPPVTDQQGQFSTEPTNLGAIAHTGNNLNATQSANSTQPGFESAAATFHNNIEPPLALIEGAQPTGPLEEAEMPEDGDCQDHMAMDTSNPQTDIQHPSTSANQQPAGLGATGQPAPAIRFTSDAIANLVQAAAAGNFWDDPEQLKGATAGHMQELHAVLQKMAASQKPAETDPNQDESEPENDKESEHHNADSVSISSGSSSSSSSSSDSDTASDTDNQKDTDRKKKKGKVSVEGVKDLFEQAEDDVFVMSDESEGECGSTKDDESCLPWTTQVNEEPDWIVRYPNAVPYVHSRVVSTDDGWYRGKDCASPSEVAPSGKNAILPVVDGSLVMKADTVLPGAPPDCAKYGERFLEKRVFHNKAKRMGHEELDPVPQAELEARALENREALARDIFWAEEIERALCLPGEADTTVNFAVKTDMGMKAIPYQMAAPMAWEYPYAFGQAQEPLQDRLVTASLYSMRLMRPGYTDPRSRPAAPAAAESQATKDAASAAYVTDADVSDSQEPSCRVANGEDG